MPVSQGEVMATLMLTANKSLHLFLVKARQQVLVHNAEMDRIALAGTEEEHAHIMEA